MTKLLFDQNLSRHLVRHLKELFPYSNHVLLLGYQEANDEFIWNYAIKNSYTIVTQDSDFFEKSILLNHPPKVIILRCGNSTTKEILDILKANKNGIEEFIIDNFFSYLELF